MTDILKLIPAIRVGGKHPHGAFKSERHFLDFVVGGQSLWDALGKPQDLVSVLCDEFALSESVRAVHRLLLNENADSPNDRRSLFICSECGDLGCGAITMLVIREGDNFLWKEFGFQNNYKQNVEHIGFSGVGPFIFDAVSYKNVLLQAVERLKASKSEYIPSCHDGIRGSRIADDNPHFSQQLCELAKYPAAAARLLTLISPLL